MPPTSSARVEELGFIERVRRGVAVSREEILSHLALTKEQSTASDLEAAVDKMERDMQRKVQMIESGEGCKFKPMPELCEAAERGDLATLTSLIAKKANPDTRGENGNTALAFAAANGHADCCSFLLQSKADISARSDWGSTSLHAAAWADCAKVIKLLVRAKANINAQQPNGATPLHFAVESKREGSVRALCMAGANRTLKRDGRTPLMEAVTLKASACELVLREFDANEKADQERKRAAMLKDKEAKANAAAEALLAELALEEKASKGGGGGGRGGGGGGGGGGGKKKGKQVFAEAALSAGAIVAPSAVPSAVDSTREQGGKSALAARLLSEMGVVTGGGGGGGSSEGGGEGSGGGEGGGGGGGNGGGAKKCRRGGKKTKRGGGGGGSGGGGGGGVDIPGEAGKGEDEDADCGAAAIGGDNEGASDDEATMAKALNRRKQLAHATRSEGYLTQCLCCGSRACPTQDLRCPSCAASRRISDPSAMNPLPLRREEPSDSTLNYGSRRHHPTTREEQLSDDSNDDSAYDVVEVVENGRTTVVIDRYGVHDVK